jgi:hypothetical protein
MGGGGAHTNTRTNDLYVSLQVKQCFVCRDPQWRGTRIEMTEDESNGVRPVP